MSHQLNGALLRIGRAQLHLNELYRLEFNFRHSNKDLVSLQQDPHSEKIIRVIFDPLLEVPLNFSLPVSDCIHNLRSALDYLIYELANLDFGSYVRGTQFPIEDDPEWFHKRRRNTYLRGLSDDHVRAIEALQPYNRIEWT